MAGVDTAALAAEVVAAVEMLLRSNCTGRVEVSVNPHIRPGGRGRVGPVHVLYTRPGQATPAPGCDTGGDSR